MFLKRLSSIFALIIFGILIAMFFVSKSTSAYAQGIIPPVPAVAIHVSELTKALETIPASGSTPKPPAFPTASGFEWWYTSWHYFVMPESLKEALDSDGTPYVVVTDADIIAGALLNPDGSPKYPILISLAAEAIHDDEIAPLRAYVNAGGFLFVGSSSFTRNPDGTTRGNFALSNEMGLSMQTSSLDNWYENSILTRVTENKIVSHIPSGSLNWYLPLFSEQIPLGTTTGHAVHQNHYAWNVNNINAEILANGSSGPLVTTKIYGDGRFIYYGVLQPLIGVGGNDSGMYSYMIFQQAIEWAFESAKLPLLKLSPWRFAHDSAFIARHDFENDPVTIQSIESFAQAEQAIGVNGEYYFSTGVLRVGSPDTQLTTAQKQAAIQSLRRAVSQYGAIIGSHNGGLANPVNPSLPPNTYDYWHWGPDEALDTSPPGYLDGKAYASSSIDISFLDIESWLDGLDNGRAGCGGSDNCPRLWVSPYFNSGREGSFEILEQLGSITMGEQELSPFPHATLSTQTDGKRFAHVSIPVSEWYVGNQTAQSLEQHTDTTMRAGVDFYYENGFLVNFYGHDSTLNYASYALTKPRIWSANSVALYDWWVLRQPVIVSPVFSQNGNVSIVTAAVSNAVDPETAVEVVIPDWSSGAVTNLQVLLDGVIANPGDYRTTDYGVKVRVGNSISNVEISYEPACTDPTSCNPVFSIPARWRCNGPECSGADWIGSVISWPSWSAYPNNARSGDQSRTVYTTDGDILYPYMGLWAEGCQITAVSGTVVVIEWERGTNIWRETYLGPGQSHTIALIPPENGALIEGPESGFSISLSNCTPQILTDETPTPTPSNPITIGETNVLSIDDFGRGNFLVAQSTNLPQNGTLQSISFFVATASGQMRMGVYSDSNSSPGTLLAQTAAFTPANGWNTRNVTTPIALPAGTYWLAFLLESNSLYSRYELTGTARGFSFPFGELPNSFSTSPLSANLHYSLYASLSADLQPTSTFTNTPQPSNTPTPLQTSTPTPVNTPTPTFTNTPPPTNTATPGPTLTPSVTPTDAPPPSGETLHLSSTGGGTVGGVAFADEDILSYDLASGAWSLYVDGSDIGLGSTDVNAFSTLSDGSILLSVDTALTIGSLGTVDDSDIVRFIPTTLGVNTAGTFEWYFDGSDVGLTTTGEDIDSIGFAQDGRLVISTTDTFGVTGASGADEDLLAFLATSLGSTTNGTWSLYFDGSDVGLADSANEDVNGLWVNPANENIYLSTVGSFSVNGTSGDGTDIFICVPTALGSNTVCAFDSQLYWDGSTNGFSGQVIDGFDILLAQVLDTPTPTFTPVLPTATNTPVNTVTFTPLPPTATNTPVNTATFTPVPPTATNTPVNTATFTPLPPTATNTPVNTATFTPVPPTATNTPTFTPAPPTATNSPTPTNTPVNTATPTLTPSVQILTIGETSILNIDDSGNANILIAQAVVLPQSATIQSLSFYVTSTGGQLQLGIYDDVGGNPGTLRAQTAAFSPLSGWNTQNVLTPTLLPAGTYWLAYLPESNSLGYRVGLTGSARGYYYSFGTMPGAYPSQPLTAEVHWSLYATFTK